MIKELFGVVSYKYKIENTGIRGSGVGQGWFLYINSEQEAPTQLLLNPTP